LFIWLVIISGDWLIQNSYWRLPYLRKNIVRTSSSNMQIFVVKAFYFMSFFYEHLVSILIIVLFVCLFVCLSLFFIGHTLPFLKIRIFYFKNEIYFSVYTITICRHGLSVTFVFHLTSNPMFQLNQRPFTFSICIIYKLLWSWII